MIVVTSWKDAGPKMMDGWMDMIVCPFDLTSMLEMMYLNYKKEMKYFGRVLVKANMTFIYEYKYDHEHWQDSSDEGNMKLYIYSVSRVLLIEHHTLM